MTARLIAATDISGFVPEAIFNVKYYGAKGDGTTDDSAAILAAVNAAASVSPLSVVRGAIYFPVGIYRVTQSAVLTQTNTGHGVGMKYYGDGGLASIIRLDTSAAIADMYFYNNGSTAREYGASFVDLGFQGMNPSSFVDANSISNFAKGFRIWATTATGSHEQNFHFTRCVFNCLNIVIDLEGDNTASENSWVQCEFDSIKNNVLLINNPQSFNNRFSGCDFTNIYGDTFLVTSGGGAISVYGASVILNDKPSASVDTFFLNLEGSVGPGAQPFIFDGIRFELRDAHCCLVKIPTTAAQNDITFSNCNLEDFGTGTKSNWVAIGAYATVAFDHCDFYEFSATPIRFTISNSGGLYGQCGAVVFESCGIPVDWSDRCIYSSFAGGTFSARNCHGTNVGVPAAGWHWAHDFDAKYDEVTPGLYTGWAVAGNQPGFGSPTDNNFKVKVAQIKLFNEFWPSSGGNLTLRLPRNAIIKAVHLRKTAGGSTATVATARVSNNNQTTIHLATNSAAANTALTGDLNDYYYNVGTTDNERNLLLSFSSSIASTVPGGLALIEYI